MGWIYEIKNANPLKILLFELFELKLFYNFISIDLFLHKQNRFPKLSQIRKDIHHFKFKKKLFTLRKNARKSIFLKNHQNMNEIRILDKKL